MSAARWPERAPAEGAPALPPGPPALRFRWERTIDRIERVDWEACFGLGDVYLSYDLALSVERAGLPGISHHYLVGEAGGRTRVIVPCFLLRVSTTLMAPRWVQRAVGAGRRLFPGLLYFDLFEVGTPIAICRDYLGVAFVEERDRVHILHHVKAEVLRRAKEVGAGVVAVKEISRALLPLVREAFEPEFLMVETLPTTFVPLATGDMPPYAERLNRKYRQSLVKRKQLAHDAGIRWDFVEDFAPFADEAHALYMQVLERAELRFETLTPAFFREVSKNLGGRSLAVVGRRGEQLVAFELCLRDERWIHPVYLGIDYDYRDSAAIYFNTIYRIMEECEVRRYPVVQLGQSAYEAKALMGAVMSRLWIGIHPRNWLLRWVLRRLRLILFPSPRAISHNVFKDARASRRVLHDHGVDFEGSKV